MTEAAADSPGTELLRVRELGVTLPTEDGPVHAVRGVSFSLRAGEVLGMVGESGSGKTVTSLALLGLLPRTAAVVGSAVYRGTELVGAPPARLRALRGRRISMVFQDPMTAFNPVQTIGQQLAEAVRAHQPVTRRQGLARAQEMLELVGIAQAGRRLRAYPHEFSGGMRQRAMIALAVINRPDVIIADEPTTAVDVTVQAQILEMLLTVKDEVGAAILLITHDLGVVAGVADRVLVLYAGRSVEDGATDEIFYAPRMPYTVGLLGSLRPGPGGRLRSVAGLPPALTRLPPGCAFAPRCPLATARCHTSEPQPGVTDAAGHLAACHRWPALAAAPDPYALFGGEGGCPP